MIVRVTHRLLNDNITILSHTPTFVFNPIKPVDETTLVGLISTSHFFEKNIGNRRL